MQHSTQHKRSALVALGVILALVAGVFGASPAFAVPPDPTSHIEDGGDGILNVNEVEGVTVTGTYDTTADVAEIRARIVASDVCDPTAATSDTLDATLNGDGTWEAGPFDITHFADGTTVCAKSRTKDSTGTNSANSGDSDNRPVIDLTVPEILIFDVATDGTIGIDEAAAGVDVAFETSDDVTSSSLEVANDGDAAPAACTFADLGTGPAELVVGSDCFDALADGAISFTLSASNDIGGTVSESVSASLDRVLSLEILDDIDNGHGYQPGVANAAETADGLKVRFDIDPSLGDEVVTAELSVTDGTTTVSADSDPETDGDQPFTMSATSSEDVRTLSVDVSGLDEGAIAAAGTITRADGTTTHSASDDSLLDVRGPQVSWDTTDGTIFVKLCPVFFGACNSVMEGSAADTGLTSGVQFVYLRGTNLDTGATFSAPAPIASRDAAQTDWSLSRNLEAGEWEGTAQSGDLAGNVGAPVTISFTVVGAL